MAESATTLHQLRKEAARAYASGVRLAREDPNTFIELVLKHIKTGKPVIQSKMHEEWQGLITAHDRLLVTAHVGSGKTLNVAIGRVLWELGRNHNLSIVILGNTIKGQPNKIVRTLKRYIEESTELHEIFPDLLPGSPWTDSYFTVKRDVIRNEPTLQATGVHGSIMGARIDLLLIDDILDSENTRTEHMMLDTWQWFQETIPGRMMQGARAICIGNAWHEKDMLHRLQEHGWVSKTYPVCDENGKSNFPAEYPDWFIAKKRAELGPIESARQLDCVARNDATSRFKLAWINKALARGNGLPLAEGLRVTPPGCRVITGVDLAVSKKDAADLTVLFTALEMPNGDRRLLNLRSGKWSGPEIIQQIEDVHRRYGSIIWVESNAGQEYILQFTRATSAVPVKSFLTGRNKADAAFGVESLATELDNGKWIFPNNNGVCDPEVEKLISEMTWYDPTKHTGDRVMAMWICREGIRDAPMAMPEGEIGYLDLRIGGNG